MKFKSLALLSFLLLSFSVFAKQASIREKKTADSKVKKVDLLDLQELERLYVEENPSKQRLALLKKQSLKLSNKAVPLLIKVMKSDDYPEKNRWVATFMLGRIMGKKASNYIAKYIVHPNWMLRLASLKTLLHLQGKKYTKLYKRALNDKSMIVRLQALENVTLLKITELAPDVWKMLFDKKNYQGLKGKRKRTTVIKKVVKAVGDLGHTKAIDELKLMASKEAYKDILPELDYSLSKLTGKASPRKLEAKRIFWKEARL